MLDIIMTLAESFRAQHKQLYMVGGTVRDVLLHREQSNDADLATDAQPDEIKRLVAPTRPSAIVLVGERFGTVRLHYGSDIIEITTFRTERYNPESRKPEVCFGTRLEDDLLRRDFTINALARDPLNGHIIDLFGGRQDLETHILRAVGNEPDKRFDEDPLRLLRAVRFAAQLDFTIEPQTRRSILRQAPKLQKISRERIRDEMNKLLVSPHPAKGLDLLVELGLMVWIVPEVVGQSARREQWSPRRRTLGSGSAASPGNHPHSRDRCRSRHKSARRIRAHNSASADRPARRRGSRQTGSPSHPGRNTRRSSGRCRC